jgi:hypothetical protein
MMLVTRAALAAPFELQVRSIGRVDQLRGVFSWVAIGLHAEREDRVYLELDFDFQDACDLLPMRIYGLGAPADGDTT